MMEGAEPTGHGSAASHQVAHPTPLTYAIVAAILGAITGIEVGIFYVEALEDVIIPIFLVLSATKFAMVAMFYMHLKFDHRLFSGFFVGGLLLASSVLIALLALFGSLIGDDEVPGIAAAHGDSAEQTEAVVTQESAPTVPSGELLFVSKACGSCHTLEGVAGAVGVVGPGMNGIASRAEERVPGLSAEEYVRQSIEEPSAFVVEDFFPLMPSLRATMSDEEFETLVSFLLTLE